VSRRTRIRVIIAEDDPSLRDALAAIIGGDETLDLVAAVGDAETAIQAAEHLRPDVAILDVRMPGGGGTEAARGIKRRSPQTKVLALSAHEDRVTVMEMLEAGAVGYLVKGTSIDRIVDSVRQAAVGQASLSAEVTGPVINELVEQRTAVRRDEERARLRRGRIERAIADEDALTMVFQPICELEGHNIVGVEALARFKCSPIRGPERWFAEAGEVGLREELELAAVRRAVARLAELPPEIFLTVNASPATVGSTGFRRLLSGDECAGRVVIEITEHAPIDDYDKLNVVVSRLRGFGIRLAIDDAGAGFASLRHILRLGPDFIKLDRTLIDGIARDRSRQALAAGLISFANKASATIVAEGIERDEEIATLIELGVTYGQGYLLARPAPLPLPPRGARNGARSTARHDRGSSRRARRQVSHRLQGPKPVP
jgi:EAL domain-containing protein (putative c-di-GMP-specific phosphodiesterase class I)/CheY-like chemotaxis protein